MIFMFELENNFRYGRMPPLITKFFSLETTMAAKNKVRGSVSNLEQATTSVNERILKVCQKRDYFYFFSSQFVLKLAVKMLLAQSLHQYNSFIIFLFIQHVLALLCTYQTLVGFGRACAPVRCAHPFCLAHLHVQRGAARPPPIAASLLLQKYKN